MQKGKFAWNIRGHRSILEYVIINEKLGKLFSNVIVMGRNAIGSNHYLVRTKVKPVSTHIEQGWDDFTKVTVKAASEVLVSRKKVSENPKSVYVE